MFKISDFSKLTQVSPRTLRYYEELGLLKPAHVDVSTGYRYYDVEQLPLLNRIAALKDLGFELAEIADLLRKNISQEQIRQRLAAKRHELEHQIQADQQRLGRINAQLRLLEVKDDTADVVLKKVESQTIASCTEATFEFTPRFDLGARVLELVQQSGLKPVGPLHYVYHEHSQHDSYTNVEAGIPINPTSAVPLATSLVQHELPRVETMAALVYQGNPFGIFEGYQSLGQWIQANQYVIAGPCRKICLRHSGDLSHYLTEIQFPVESAASGFSAQPRA